MKSWWVLLKEAAANWSKHKDARQGAALAYYSIFSLGPLMVIAIAIAGLVFGQEAVRGEVGSQLKGLLGEGGAQAVQTMLAGASKPQQGIVATILGVGTLLFAAVGVVVQLKDALNTVWEVESPKSGGLWLFMRTYIVSLAGVLAVGFLLLVSLLLTTVLSAGGKYFALYLPETALHIVGSILSFGVITLLFAMMFKWLPDTPVNWRNVWLGAAITGALFEIGKVLIGLYIGKQGLESTYGAAASLVVLLIWIYYSSQIVLMGAEFTQVHAQRVVSPKSNAGPSLAKQSERRPSDPIQAGVRRSPFSAIFLALGAGWLARRIWEQSTGAKRGRRPLLAFQYRSRASD